MSDQDLSDHEPTLLGRVLRIPVEIIVAIYVVLDAIVAPLFGPLMRWLSGLRLIQRIEAVVAGLPPYVILVLLVLPFGVAELAKLYAVVLMAEEHFRTGLTIFVGAYVVSILVCERTFQAGRSQLMTIGWFKRGFDWVTAVKTRILGWVRQTRVWQSTQALKARMADRLRRWRRALGMGAEGTVQGN